jgi:methylthioribose-1-phosphate isomerase
VPDPEIIETVRWRDGMVRILDQTRLPAEEVYLELATTAEVVDAIRRLAVRGAPAIGVTGALAVAQAAAQTGGHAAPEWIARVQESARAVADARPTAVNLRWAVDRVVSVLWRAAGSGAGVDTLQALALAEAQSILAEDLALSAAMGAHGASLLPEEGQVLTHCNTGGLATAGGGTALGVVFEAVRQGKRIFVYADETRPLLQGARLTTWELQRAGIPCALICDGAAAWLFRTRRIDAVLVGADRVAANGDTANKIGTLAVALAARACKVPFFVVAPRSSFDLSLPDGQGIPIEERDPEEVLSWPGGRVAPGGVEAWNPAFDVTPAGLVSGWVTERGVERPPFVETRETEA